MVVKGVGLHTAVYKIACFDVFGKEKSGDLPTERVVGVVVTMPHQCTVPARGSYTWIP